MDVLQLFLLILMYLGVPLSCEYDYQGEKEQETDDTCAEHS